MERGELEESSGWSLGGFEGPLGGFVMGGEEECRAGGIKSLRGSRGLRRAVEGMGRLGRRV